MVGVALTDGPAYLNVPSMALRRDLLKIVYRRPEVMLHPGYAVLTAHDGWAPAIEPHMEADERPRYCRAFFITDEELYRSHFGPTMAQFYNLARRHGARSSLVIDPSACPPDRTWLAARQADVERFLAEHPDAVVYPRQVWEPMPEETYASPIHVLPSYRQILTEGVRRALAKVD